MPAAYDARQLLALCLLAGLSPCLAAPGTKGLFLVGGSTSERDPPVLAFGPEEQATAVTSLGDGLQVVRQGMTEMIISPEVVQLPAIQATDAIEVEALSVGGAPQFALWDLDTFDSPTTGMWSANDRSVCGVPGDLFLGGHCRFGATTTARVYNNLPPHKRLRIQARFHFFDDWNGEAVAMQVDNSTVWSHSHSWCPGFLNWICEKYGVDSCGRDTPDTLSLKAEVTMTHTSPTLKLAFGSNLAAGSDSCRVSWGVDDVSVELA